MGKTLGDPADPLLVSVRSGAAASMPGMMETVLNVGLNDESVQGLAAQSGSERFAWDSYRRLIQMFGKTVLDIDGELFDDALDAVKAEQGTDLDLDLDAEHLRGRRRPVQGHRPRAHRPRLPAGPARADGPGDQRRLRLVELRPGDHLPPPRADPQRRRHRRQRLLDGVRQPRHRLRHRRRLHPRPGQRRAGRLRRLPAERPGRGRRRRHPQHRAAGRPGEHRRGRLRRAHGDRCRRLESHYRDLCDIEFTVERNKLWMLQTRVGKRAPRPRRSSSPPSWSTRASSTWTRRSAGSPATSWRS